MLIWNERLPYCDTRVILQRQFSKRRRIKTKKKESSTCGPQVCRRLKLDGKWRKENHGGFVSPRSTGRPWTLVGKSKSTPKGNREEDSHEQTLSCFPVLPGIRPAFWSLLSTQLPVNVSGEMLPRYMSLTTSLLSPDSSFRQIVVWVFFGTFVSDSKTEAWDGECPGLEETPRCPSNPT